MYVMGPNNTNPQPVAPAATPVSPMPAQPVQVTTSTTSTMGPLPATLNVDKPAKGFPFKIILLILIPLLILGGAGYGGYYYTEQSKKEVKSLANNQSNNLSKLKGIYANIIAEVRASQNQGKAPASQGNTQVLGAATSSASLAKKIQNGDVLGLEDSPELITLRKLGEYYKDGVSVSSDINNIDIEVESKSENPMLKPFLKVDPTLIERSKKLAKNNTALMTYFNESNKLSIKIYSTTVDWGLAVANALQNGINDNSLAAVHQKAEDIKAIEKDYRALNTDDLPKVIADRHQSDLAEFPSVIKILEDIEAGLKAKDLQAIQNSIVSIQAELPNEETQLVEIVSFFQDDEDIRSIDSLLKDWQNLSGNL